MTEPTTTTVEGQPHGEPAGLRTNDEDAALAKLDAAEDVPFVKQVELDAIEAISRDVVKPPEIDQIHPKQLYGDEAAESAPAPKAPEQRADTDPDQASKLEAASTLLGKMQVPASVKDALTDEAKLDWAAQLEPVYAKNASAYREVSELRREVETLRAQPNATLPAPDQTQASPPAPAEPREHPGLDLDVMESGFATEFGEDAAKAFRKPFEALQGQQSAYTAEMAQMRGLLRDQLVVGARRELAGEFPQLSDPAVFAKVKDTADLLLGTGRFAKYDDAMRKAAQVELAEDVANAKAQERFQVSDERDNGQMSVPERVAPTQREPLGAEASEDFVIAMLEKGYTPEQARVELSRRNGQI